MDAHDIVTGRSKYTGDIKLPEMLYGKVLRSPHPHANIKGIDTSKAEALKGVRKVLTYKNVPKWMVGMPATVPVLDDKVRFVGDAVALVAADTEKIAEEACDLITVEYEPLPAVYDFKQALEPGGPQLYKQFENNVLTPGCPVFGPNNLKNLTIGDADKGLTEADAVTEGNYVFENIPNPLPPESPSAIAQWTGPKSVTIWTAAHHAHMVRWKMMPKFNFDDVRAIVGPCGGSYGSKSCSTQVVLYAAALAKVTGRPVMVNYTKKEHLDTYVLRLSSSINAKVGVNKDGKVTAMKGEWLVNTGVFSEMTQGQVAVGLGEVQLLLRCPNWDLKNKIVVTNRQASGIIRGFGGQELKSAFIPIVTLAMQQADVDPVEFFKKNFVKPGDKYLWRNGEQYTYRGIDYSPCMEKGAEVFDWKSKWKGWLVPTAATGTKRRGVGVGVHGNCDVGEERSEAYVQLRPGGSAVVFTAISEPGMGQRSNMRKMAAEVLNLPLDKVNMSPPDSLVTPYDFGLSGSRGTRAVGTAVIMAADEALKKLFTMGAPKLGAKPEELETKDGLIWARSNPDKKLPWIAVLGLDRTVQGEGLYEQDFSLCNFIMTFAEVDVDIETGKVDLVRVLSTTDVGQIIDPNCLTNQIHGGLGAAGLDSAIFEETVLDRSLGRVLSSNLIDYKWRTFEELPEFQTIILETPVEASHRFKAIGVGEITTAPGPSAILMAISNAIGQRMFEYPITPARILAALGKVQGGRA
ncbi:MAG: xanthine dehydrogenase family protein molybdopterin-binding subunit [Candidatus Korobacteraceae bacterium]|jgi:xanthine dehydrogenase molybdenum-binding subunit